MLKNWSACHSKRSEESRRSFVSRARFLASLGMTAIKRVLQHPPKALMRLFTAGWMRGTPRRSSFGQGWRALPILACRYSKLENRNSKLGKKTPAAQESLVSIFEFRFSSPTIDNRQSAIGNRRRPTRAPPRGGALPLPPPGTEHLRQCWWRDQRGAPGRGQ